MTERNPQMDYDDALNSIETAFKNLGIAYGSPAEMAIETLRTAISEAKKMKELREARKKATQGEWKLSKHDDLPYIFSPKAENDFGPVIARFDYSRKDRDFILLAANLTREE